jgi:transposase
MKNSNKVEIVFSLWEAGVHPEQISAQLNIHRATTYRWIKDFQHLGLNRTLIKRSKSKSRTQSRKINQVVKNRIYKIRKDKRDCCGEKSGITTNKSMGRQYQ